MGNGAVTGSADLELSPCQELSNLVMPAGAMHTMEMMNDGGARVRPELARAKRAIKINIVFPYSSRFNVNYLLLRCSP